MKTLTINSLSTCAAAIAEIEAAWKEHHYLEIEIKRVSSQRTITQNRALHLFLGQLSEALNDAGFDMMAVLKHDAEIPWNPALCKEHLWRPIQEAMTQKRSTTEITTVEPTAIHETLCRHLGQKLGVQCPDWPSRDHWEITR